jgi:4-amino-4-deoxy-L-arabinose transferase-like glycosyltransferase
MTDLAHEPRRPDSPNLAGPATLSRCRILIVVLVLAGAGCRLAQFLSRQAFWEDEVAVLVNLQHHSARELPFVKLESYSQESPVAAPPVFLWTTQWMGQQFNYSEFAVRAMAMVCSILVLPLFAHLAWRMIGPVGAVWAVALMALSDPLIFQAANVKPYSGDVLLAVLILWAAFVPSANAPPQRKLAAAAVVTIPALWMSYPAIFVFAAVGLALLPDLIKSSPQRLIAPAICLLAVAGSFLAVDVLCIRAQRNANLDVYWMHLFPDFTHPMTLPRWLIGGTWEMFHFQFYPVGPIMLAAVAMGCWHLHRTSNRAMLTLLLAPWILNLVAACMGQFPYGGSRLTLFLTPFLSLLIGIGAAAVPLRLPDIWRWAWLVLAIVPVAMVGYAAYQLKVPRSKGNLRDAVTFLNAHRAPDEEAYLVGNQTLGAAMWYLPNRDPLIHDHLEQSAPIHGTRYWIVISYEPRKLAENKKAMTQPGVRVDESRSFHTSGADVLWFVPQ